MEWYTGQSCAYVFLQTELLIPVTTSAIIVGIGLGLGTPLFWVGFEPAGLRAGPQRTPGVSSQIRFRLVF